MLTNFILFIFLELDADTEENFRSDDRKKRPRTAFTASQIKCLEAEFEKNKYLSVAKRLQLSKSLKLTETQVNEIFTFCPKFIRKKNRQIKCDGNSGKDEHKFLTANVAF